jgi:hypothetical protein
MNPWDRWEDWHAGLYEIRLDAPRIKDARALLSDPEQFDQVAREMVRTWPHAAAHNLGHMATGHRSWLGQASACYSVGASSLETRHAWGELTNGQQRNANAIATAVRDDWRKGACNGETLFGH